MNDIGKSAEIPVIILQTPWDIPEILKKKLRYELLQKSLESARDEKGETIHLKRLIKLF